MSELAISRVLCINLDYRTDRWAHMCEQAAEHGLPPLERFSAIRPTEPAPGLTIGATGAFLSHRAVWQRLVDEGSPAAIVFEDDAVLCDDFVSRCNTLVAALPAEWDLVYLGYWLRASEVTELDALRIEARNTYCLYGYLVSQGGAAKLFGVASELRMPIDDLLLSDAARGLRLSAAKQPLVESASFGSDIRPDGHADERAALDACRSGLAPLPLDGRKAHVLLHHPWWARNGWRDVLGMFLREFSVDDDVTLVLWADPRQGYPVGRAFDMVSELITQTCADPERSGNLILLGADLDAEGVARLFAAANWVVPHYGEPLQEERARRLGIPVLGVLARVPSVLRAALGGSPSKLTPNSAYPTEKPL